MGDLDRICATYQPARACTGSVTRSRKQGDNMVKIRLSRQGAKKQPFYQIVVADGRAHRDGQFIERIGFFNPVARGSEERLRFDRGRYEYWVKNGAQVTARVNSLASEAAKQAALASATAEGDAPQAA